MIDQYDNVVILRTFSKLFSMAACRLGVIISNPNIIEYVRKSHLTFDVNAIALKFGERILEQKDLVDQMICKEKEGKNYTLDILKEKGYVIARRTVAKYREQLGIPVARLRKEI